MKELKANKEQLRQAARALLNHGLNDALQLLNALATQFGEEALISELESIQSTYASILAFIKQNGSLGNGDCEQHKRELEQRTLNVWSRLSRSFLLSNENGLYYKTLQSVTLKDWDTEWTATTDTDERFALQDEIFDYLWTSPLWTERDTAFWFEFISRQNALVAQHLTGAVSFSVWLLWDYQKILLLKMLAADEHIEVQMQAAAGYIVAAIVHEDLFPLFPDAVLLPVDRLLRQHIITLQPEFIRMVECQKLEETENGDEAMNMEGPMNDERLRLVMEAQKKYNRIRVERQLDMAFGKRTILHFTPFLRTLSHWWAPFDQSRSEVSKACYTKDGTVATPYKLMVECSHECDLQLYLSCFMLSGDNVQVSIQGDLSEEAISNIDASPLAIHKRVVQNLYRICKLSPVHNLLSDVFLSTFFPNNRVLAPCFEDEDVQRHAAHILEIGAKEKVLDKLMRIAGQHGLSAQLAVLIALANIREKEDYATALSYYRQSDLLEDSSPELVEAMALCCHKLQRPKDELEYLERLSKMKPDNLVFCGKLAHLYYITGNYAEAKKHFYRIYYEQPDITFGCVQLIFTLMQLGEMEQAAKHVHQLLADAPEKREVQLVAAIYYFITDDWAAAFRQLRRPSMEELLQLQSALRDFGMTAEQISLVVDACLT